MSRYASRKFLLAFYITSLATWLVARGSITDVIYSGIIIAVISGYFAANVTQKATLKEKSE
jgi:hypothetical protein